MSSELSLHPVVLPAGGISVTYTGLPIMVCLANTPVSFSCRINNEGTPEFKDFTVSFFYEDLHGKRSLEKPIDCQHSPGAGNQTLDCVVKLSLPNASATGTYYCLVQGRSISAQGSGTFILVRGKASSWILPGRMKCEGHPAVSLPCLLALQTEQEHAPHSQKPLLCRCARRPPLC